MIKKYLIPINIIVKRYCLDGQLVKYNLTDNGLLIVMEEKKRAGE